MCRILNTKIKKKYQGTERQRNRRFEVYFVTKIKIIKKRHHTTRVYIAGAWYRASAIWYTATDRPQK